MTAPAPILALRRDVHYFTDHPGLAQRLEHDQRPVSLAPDELLHPPVPAEYVVRRGKLRVSQFLDDGREVTRAVLQAGATFRTLAGAAGADPAADVYFLPELVLMALGEAELWALEPGSLAPLP